jgi:hypothetical protein
LRFFTQIDRRAADDSNEAKAKKEQEEEEQDMQCSRLPTNDKRGKIIT